MSSSDPLVAIQSSIADGLCALRRQQLSDGGFPSQPHRTVFFTALVLRSLASISEDSLVSGDTTLGALTAGGMRFLLTQRTSQWSWNYWVRHGTEARHVPLPEDLDDTFQALIACFLVDPTSIDAAALAAVVKLLTIAEEKPGGPYRTWLLPTSAPPSWCDVDIAVNATIAFFLSLRQVKLTSLDLFLQSAVEQASFNSPYYASRYSVVYFLSAFFSLTHDSAAAQTLRQYILAQQTNQGVWGNSLETALALSSLLNLGVSAELVADAAHFLLSSQRDGSWIAYPFGIERVVRGKKYYSSSESLTTALCLEALAKYHRALKSKTPATKVIKEDEREAYLQGRILKAAAGTLSLLPGVIRRQGEAQLAVFGLRHDFRDVVLLPYFFAHAFLPKRALQTDLMIELGLANLYGWSAYTLYDDILDGEATPELLPLANIHLRSVEALYRRLLPTAAALRVYEKIMNDMEGVSAWEYLHCNLGEYVSEEIRHDALSRRSLGHGLGPLTLLFLDGYGAESKEVQAVLAFFAHYLVMKQLNDDAHDWIEDLRRGKVNSVAALMSDSFSAAPLSEPALRVLRQRFWKYDIVKVQGFVAHHGCSARRAVEGIPIFSGHTFWEEMLVPLELVARQAVVRSQEALDFLAAYVAPAPFS